MDGERCVGRDLAQDCFGARDQIGRRDDLVDEADAVGFLGPDHAAGEDQLERAALADDARQSLGAAAARHQAELDLGQAELCMLGGNADGAGQRRLAPAAERKAIDCRDHRLAEIFEQVVGLLDEAARPLRFDRAGMREFADVGAGRERLVAGSGEDDAAHRRVVPGVFQRQPQLGQSGIVERVEDRRTVERDVGDRALFLVQHVLEIERGRRGCFSRRRGRERSHDRVS